MTPHEPMPEAQMRTTPAGLVPTEPGWWIANLGDLAWKRVDGGGTWCSFEDPDARSTALGVGVHVLPPGESSGKYHAEQDTEGFLVLRGTCLVLVEGEERPMREGDYFHCPPDTAHVIVGAGAAPCALFMLGTRTPDAGVRYLPDAVAARHGVAVAEETASSAEAYTDRATIEDAPSPWPLPGS